MNNFLFELATRSAILAGIGLALRFALLRSSAHARAIVLALTMGALVLLPIALLALPRMAVTVAKQEVFDAPSNSIAGSLVSEPQPSFPWMIIWAAVCALMIARVITSLIQFRKLERGFSPASTSLTLRVKQLAVRAKSVFFCPEGEPPMTWGLVQPKIALPKESEGWIEPQLRSVVLHEDAHIRRRDWAVMIGFRVITALYWFNPLVWVLKVLFEQDSERAADDFVLAQGIDAPEYAGRLVEVAKTLQNRPSRVPAITMARSNRLNGRIAAILCSQTKRGILRGWTKLTVLGVLLIGAVSAGMIMPVVKEVRLTSKPSNEPFSGPEKTTLNGAVDVKLIDPDMNKQDSNLSDEKEVREQTPPTPATKLSSLKTSSKSNRVTISTDDMPDLEFDPETSFDMNSISRIVNQGVSQASDGLKMVSKKEVQAAMKKAVSKATRDQRELSKVKSSFAKDIQDSLGEAKREIAKSSIVSEKDFKEAEAEIDSSDIPESAKAMAKQSIQLSRGIVNGLLDGFMEDPKSKKKPKNKPTSNDTTPKQKKDD